MLLLASASPRRRELLAQIGLRCTVVPADIDETLQLAEPPRGYVRRLALEKARAVHYLHPQSTVLGADTTVILDGHVLNKPHHPDDARRMLKSLSDRTHEVATGVAVVTPTGEYSIVETASVTFSAIPEIDLERYIASGDPLDKAGAYGIQGFAARWIPHIEGDFFNVVGLPLAATVRLLAQSGYAEPLG